jgi:excisionase family DNA binding protein
MVKWESIAEYSKRTGVTKDTVRKLIKSGMLQAETTDGGGKLMIKVDIETTAVEIKVATIEQKLDALLKHLGVQV